METLNLHSKSNQTYSSGFMNKFSQFVMKTYGHHVWKVICETKIEEKSISELILRYDKAIFYEVVNTTAYVLGREISNILVDFNVYLKYDK